MVQCNTVNTLNWNYSAKLVCIGGPTLILIMQFWKKKKLGYNSNVQMKIYWEMQWIFISSHTTFAASLSFFLSTGSCRAAGYTTCCVDDVCEGVPSLCFCDIFCAEFEDCCEDFYEICPPEGEKSRIILMPHPLSLSLWPLEIFLSSLMSWDCN